MTITRRQVLWGVAASVGSSVAGCLSSPNPSPTEGETSGSAAFYTLMDWGNEIGGDAIEFETPVEVGEMGHGWDPDADIVPHIAQHDVFLYLGTPEFQWAVDVADELGTDDHDVRLIDGMDALSPEDLLPFAGEAGAHLPDPDTDAAYGPTTNVSEFDVILGEEVVAYWHGDHWHGGIPEVPREDYRRLLFSVEDEEGNVLPLGEGEPFTVEAHLGDGAPNDIVHITNEGSAVELHGESTGQTTIRFEVRFDGEVIFHTGDDPSVVTVVDPDDVEIDAFHDPHVWPDPVHAQTIVSHITEELVEEFPEAEESLRANASAYTDRLAEVDGQFEALVADAELDVAVYVAHDAFQYLEDRYGFELRTPVGVTPDAAESIEDVAELATLIEERSIDTILFDPFEAPDPDEDVPQAVRVLLDDTSASNAEPLTPVEGITPSWQEAGYGWVEQMEEINLPSLRKALRA